MSMRRKGLRAAAPVTLVVFVVGCSSGSEGGSPDQPDGSSLMDATNDGLNPTSDGGDDSSPYPGDAAPDGPAPSDGAVVDAGLGAACVASGGTLTTEACCTSSDDFPSTCLIGACGCSPANSHTVQLCDCGSGKCWNGATCTPRDQ